VAAAYRAVCRHVEVRALLEAGTATREMPFTLATASGPVRGTIDCLVRTREGITVLEFKTGRRRPEHVAQLATYRTAVAALFPGVTVEARLIYGTWPS
jgi:ATP-dependent helicase/nuclease subunit A